MTGTSPAQNQAKVSYFIDTWTFLTQSGAGKVARTEWLTSALQTAIRLEFSTIPPYLTALWSIKDQTSPVALAIRGVVQEEMLHMALACNMLVAIGGTPPIANPHFAPRYPGPLPGDVHSGLRVGLSGLCRDVVKTFMIIERPEAPLDHAPGLLRASDGASDEGATGIGAFYETILAAFRSLSPELATDRQISGPLSWYAVRTLEEVETAIKLIKHQGEGSTIGPGEGQDKVTGKHELAHYFRFLEIHEGKAIGPLKDGTWGFTGEAMPWPEVWPVAEVPAGGYDPAKVAPPVAALLTRFDKVYARLLQQLHDLWATGDQGFLVQAIATMFTLQDPAIALMQIPIPGDAQGRTYAPNFRPPGDGR